jgi:hypothetical protein
LLCGLHFPNGLQRLGSKLLVVESGRFRILAVDAERLLREQRASGLAAPPLLKNCGERGSLKESLKDGKQGVSVYLSDLPGFPDNIRISPWRQSRHGSLLLCGLAAKSSQPFSLLWSVYQSVWARLLVGRLLPMKWVEKLIPRAGLVLVVSNPKALLDGRSVVAARAPGVVTLQDSSGRLAFVSEAQIHPSTGALWLGTHHNPTHLSILSAVLFDAGLASALSAAAAPNAQIVNEGAERTADLAPSVAGGGHGAGGGVVRRAGDGLRKIARLVRRILEGPLRFANAIFSLVFPPISV